MPIDWTRMDILRARHGIKMGTEIYHKIENKESQKKARNRKSKKHKDKKK